MREEGMAEEDLEEIIDKMENRVVQAFVDGDISKKIYHKILEMGEYEE